MNKEVTMKQIVWVLAVSLCVTGSAFAGVDKYCET